MIQIWKLSRSHGGPSAPADSSPMPIDLDATVHGGSYGAHASTADEDMVMIDYDTSPKFKKEFTFAGEQ